MNYPIFEVTITICIKILELVVGVEPTKGRLQIYCSTVVPHQHAPRIFIEYRGFPLSHQVYDSLDTLGCYPSRIFTSSALKVAVYAGVEPAISAVTVQRVKTDSLIHHKNRQEFSSL